MKIWLKSSKFWSTAFDLETKKQELEILEKEMQSPQFWVEKEKAAAFQKRFRQLQNEVKSFVLLQKELNDLKELAALPNSADLAEQIQSKTAFLGKELHKKSWQVFLSGKYDQNDAILSVQAGAGGRDAEDWVCLLLKMYQKYCDQKDWGCKILSQNFTQAGGPEGRIGLKEVEIEIRGLFAYGLLKKESGIHRLVRISPFSAKHLRHTSFARVEVIPKIKEEEISEEVFKPGDLKIETFRSSGPGGQNVNRRETAVRITHLPSGLIASSQNERYQLVNKKTALEILAGKFLQLKEQEMEKELAKIRGQKTAAAFGHQIRSYVEHPYQLVKDHRTGVEISNVEAVLNGEIDEFIETSIYHPL